MSSSDKMASCSGQEERTTELDRIHREFRTALRGLSRERKVFREEPMPAHDKECQSPRSTSSDSSDTSSACSSSSSSSSSDSDSDDKQIELDRTPYGAVRVKSAPVGPSSLLSGFPMYASWPLFNIYELEEETDKNSKQWEGRCKAKDDADLGAQAQPGHVRPESCEPESLPPFGHCHMKMPARGSSMSKSRDSLVQSRDQNEKLLKIAPCKDIDDLPNTDMSHTQSMQVDVLANFLSESFQKLEAYSSTHRSTCFEKSQANSCSQGPTEAGSPWSLGVTERWKVEAQRRSNAHRHFECAKEASVVQKEKLDMKTTNGCSFSPARADASNDSGISKVNACFESAAFDLVDKLLSIEDQLEYMICKWDDSHKENAAEEGVGAMRETAQETVPSICQANKAKPISIPQHSPIPAASPVVQTRVNAPAVDTEQVSRSSPLGSSTERWNPYVSASHLGGLARTIPESNRNTCDYSESSVRAYTAAYTTPSI